jgi:hypothetical protein
LLRAEGYSYKQICEETGWTYTKVNRCLTEGRKAFLDRVAGIESGDECDRLAPLLSKLADGEAGAEDLAALRPHLRSCLACRATLREYRRAPSRVAALVPLVAGPHLLGRLLYRVQSLLDSAQHAVEMAGAQKAVAVAAATAALAGGGVATVQSLDHEAPHAHRALERRHAQRRHAAAPVARVAPKPTSQAAAKRTATSKRTKSGAPDRTGHYRAAATADQEFAPSPVRSTTRAAPAKPAGGTVGSEFGP